MKWLRALTEKSWVQHQASETGLGLNAMEAASMAPERIALRFFLGVVAVLFLLFAVAYAVRMELDDWRPVPISSLLWLNTLVLFASSLALQWTRQQLGQGSVARLGQGLLAGALLSCFFIIGQLLVWRQMVGDGHLLQGNPANAFFYLLTGIHGLHLLGGLWVWMRAGLRLLGGASTEQLRLSVELCSVYWHFLLLVWLLVFALISNT